MNRLVFLAQMRIAQLRARVWFDYVPSASNIADLPTRLDDAAFARLMRLVDRLSPCVWHRIGACRVHGLSLHRFLRDLEPRRVPGPPTRCGVRGQFRVCSRAHGMWVCMPLAIRGVCVHFTLPCSSFESKRDSHPNLSCLDAHVPCTLVLAHAHACAPYRTCIVHRCAIAVTAAREAEAAVTAIVYL